MNRGNTGFVGKRVRTKQDSRTEMMLFLYGCTDAALAVTTVGHLVGRYRVDERTAEGLLTAARERRA